MCLLCKTYFHIAREFSLNFGNVVKVQLKILNSNLCENSDSSPLIFLNLDYLVYPCVALISQWFHGGVLGCIASERYYCWVHPQICLTLGLKEYAHLTFVVRATILRWEYTRRGSMEASISKWTLLLFYKNVDCFCIYCCFHKVCSFRFSSFLFYFYNQNLLITACSILSLNY